MKPLTLKDILPLSEYEKIRNDFRQEVIRSKSNRRIPLGDVITLVFENHETIKFQIQEMMRAEHLHDEEKIEAEINIYNALIPDQNELSATLFVEITDEAKIKPQLDKLMGLDKGKKIFFQIGSLKVYANFEEGHSNESRISAVHYIRFKFSPGLIERWKSGREEIFLEVDHPNYQARVKLPGNMSESLARDF